MHCSITLAISLLVVMTFVNAQNLDSMEVETRDNPSAYLRKKRQDQFVSSIPELAPIVNVPQVAAPVNAPQVVAPVNVPQVVMPALHPSSGCFWSGTSPFCFAACGVKYQAMLTDSRGDGKKCWTGHKKLCCPLPAGMIKVRG